LTFTLILGESTRRSGSLLAGLVLATLALAASTMHWITRPHLFTYLLLAIWVFRLEAFFRGEERRWWIFPMLMLLWANLHGMFILGLLAFIISLAGWAWERWLEGCNSPVSGRGVLFLGLFSTLATFLTPSGFHLWEAIFDLAGGSPFITSMTAEYKPADFHNPGTWPFLILLGAILATSVLSGCKLGMARALQLAGWTLIGLYSARNIPLAAIVLAPIGAELLAAWLKESPALAGLARFSRSLERIERDLRGWLWSLSGVLLCLVLLASGISLALDGRPYQFLPERLPVAAVDWLKENPPPGRMFNEFDWGGYLLYRLWPEQKIFMDGHTHIYGDTLSREYVAIQSRAPGWESILDKYQVEWAILRTNNHLVDVLQQLGWLKAYRDDTAVILTR